MKSPILVLYVDDSPLDRQLVRDALEHEHGGFVVAEAASRAEFETALAGGSFDLVLSDFNILGFEGLQVLDTVQAHQLDIPVVIVTGTGSEEVAVEAMKRGAADYVIKTPQHIQRLPMTIHAVFEKQHLEQQRQRAEARLLALYEIAVVGIHRSLLKGGGYLSVNPAMARIYGYASPEQMLEEITDIASQVYVRPADRAALIEAISAHGKVEGFEVANYRRDGSIIWIQTSSRLVRNPGEAPFLEGFTTDITERKHTEQRLERQLQRLSALRSIDTAISSNFDLQIILNILIAHVIEELRVDAANILLLDQRLLILENTATRGFRTHAIDKTHVRVGESFAGRAALEHRTVYIANLGEYTSSTFVANLLAGEDFVSYFGVPLIAKGQVKGVLEVFHRMPLAPDQEWLDFLHTLAQQAAIAINDAMVFASLQQSNTELSRAYDATIEGWSRALDLRDRETEGHTQRVKELTLRLARMFNMGEDELVFVRWGALLHDIGKMGVPDAILLKPEPLTDEEWAMMRQHPTFAYEMLAPISYLKSAIDIPYCHHERWDGSGYPRGLSGEEIPLTARIFAVVDVWDALRSDRPYRQGWTPEAVIDYIRSEAGKQFDPRVVELFLQLMEIK